MGYKYDHDELLRAGVALVDEHGLAELTYGKLARRIGVADRTVVYYFSSKHQLVADVVGEISRTLLMQLSRALGDGRRDPDDLFRSAWPALCRPDLEGSFRVFLQLTGLAVAGVEPYRSISAELVSGYRSWVAELIDRPRAADRRAEAGALIAMIDGLMILRLVEGEKAADSAYRRLLAARGSRTFGTS